MTLVGGGSTSSLHHRPQSRAKPSWGVLDDLSMQPNFPTHPAGILAGYSATEFVSLPQNSRISVQFDSGSSGKDQGKAEGFMSLIKY